MNEPSTRHTIAFEGDAVKGLHCLIFKMQADQSSDHCAFCNRDYTDADDLGWDVFQCVAVGGTVERWQNPDCGDSYVTCFKVCFHCRKHSHAVDYIRENRDGYRDIFLENASNGRLFKVDAYHQI
jgi:hypothetical protein